jgi:hypothetical protein
MPRHPGRSVLIDQTSFANFRAGTEAALRRIAANDLSARLGRRFTPLCNRGRREADVTLFAG